MPNPSFSLQSRTEPQVLTTVGIPSTMQASLLLFRCENSWLEIPTIHGRRQERASPPQTHGRLTLNTPLVTTDSGTRHIRPKRSAKILSSFKFQRDRKQPATRPHVHSSNLAGLSALCERWRRRKEALERKREEQQQVLESS